MCLGDEEELKLLFCNASVVVFKRTIPVVLQPLFLHSFCIQYKTLNKLNADLMFCVMDYRTQISFMSLLLNLCNVKK